VLPIRDNHPLWTFHSGVVKGVAFILSSAELSSPRDGGRPVSATPRLPVEARIRLINLAMTENGGRRMSHTNVVDGATGGCLPKGEGCCVLGNAPEVNTPESRRPMFG
jgi:hypothetical protein